MFVYDPRRDAWTEVAPMRHSHGGTPAVAVIGYDPATDRWQSLPPMPDPRHGIFAGVIGNTIYLPGGAVRPGLGATTVNSAFRVSP